MNEVKLLRESWAAKGSPACEHPQLVKEYYLGAQTGDKVCTTCGEVFVEQEWRTMAR